MISSTRALLRLAVQRFTSSSIFVLTDNFLNYDVSRNSVGRYKFGEDAKIIINELAGLGVLKTELRGRHVHRSSNNSVRGYAFWSDKIRMPEDMPLAA